MAKQRAGQITATISPLSKSQLKKATKTARSNEVHKLPIQFEECDKDFIGLTVLKSHDEANVE